MTIQSSTLANEKNSPASPHAKKHLVSVIIPVYNVEKYLPQCLDSVIAQTYINLEILVVDDGSTDRCGRICDRYAAKDPRITVFHTENGGLSAARNYGLDRCHGEYISFLDSDDWMEETFIETMLNAMLSADADIGECNRYSEWKNRQTEALTLKFDKALEGEEILRRFLSKSGIANTVWDKMYQADLFREIRFPVGRNYEDVAVTYKVLDIARRMVPVSRPLIHYRVRKSSISRTTSIHNLIDLWTSYYERYIALKDRMKGTDDDCYLELVNGCMNSVGRLWRLYYGFPKEERTAEEHVMKEMQVFVREHRREVFRVRGCSRMARVACLVGGHSNPFIHFLLYYMLGAYSLIRRDRRNRMYE